MTRLESVRGGRDAVESVLRSGGLLIVRDHPELAGAVRGMAAEGLLSAVLPGVVVSTADQGRPELISRAVSRRYPDAVITGAAAARLTFWPEVRVPVVTASNVRNRSRGEHVRFCEERIAPELVARVGDVAVTAPSLTALDLGGPGIDHALLRGAASLGTMARALDLSRGRTGNAERRRLLHDSRDRPWSEAERLAHAVLRRGGVTKFRTNYAVRCGGEQFFIDIAFPEVRVAVEVDGFETHSKRPQFERDRRKLSMLTARGWRVLAVTWWQLADEPEWFLEQLRLTTRLAA